MSSGGGWGGSCSEPVEKNRESPRPCPGMDSREMLQNLPLKGGVLFDISKKLGNEKPAFPNRGCVQMKHLDSSGRDSWSQSYQKLLTSSAQ